MLAGDKLADDHPAGRAAETRLGKRARSLVNPKSGLANDYLNIFNEISMLIENYPEMPEFSATILSWRATSYDEYFSRSKLPCKETAIKAWRELDADLRTAFLRLTEEMDTLAQIAKTYVKSHCNGEIEHRRLQTSCLEISNRMKVCIVSTTQIVNHGITALQVSAQVRADQIMAKQIVGRATKKLS